MESFESQFGWMLFLGTTLLNYALIISEIVLVVYSLKLVILARRWLERKEVKHDNALDV